MVLLLKVEGCDISLSCCCSSFSHFTNEILRVWNQELGKLREMRYKYSYYDEQIQLLIFTRMKEILDHYDKPYNEGMKLFALHSDYDGVITPDECVLLLKSFGRIDPDKFEDSNGKNKEYYRYHYEIWIKMMTYAIENKKSIEFC